MEMPKCENCKFFVAMGPDKKKFGECRRRSPLFGHAGFPLVADDRWCGEHEDRFVPAESIGWLTLKDARKTSDALANLRKWDRTMVLEEGIRFVPPAQSLGRTVIATLVGGFLGTLAALFLFRWLSL